MNEAARINIVSGEGMDVEKLLGKLLHEVKGSGGEHFKRKYDKYTKGSKKKYKKYKKKHKHKGGDAYYRQSSSSHRSKKSSLINNLTGNLKSGKGLLTAIGLGVGAYEIYRTSRKSQQPQPAVGAGPQYTPSQSFPAQAAAPPPPPPRQSQAQQIQQHPESRPLAAAPAPQEQTNRPAADADRIVTQLGEEEVARRLIQVMVGAAHADGTLDGEEERAILDRLRDTDFAQEEKMFLLEELHRPRSIPELTEGVKDLRLGQAMYAVAASAVVVDTESERMWFDELGEALGISPEIRQFIEENH